MEQRNKKQKTLDRWEIHYGTFTMPPEFWTQYPQVPQHSIILISPFSFRKQSVKMMAIKI